MTLSKLALVTSLPWDPNHAPKSNLPSFIASAGMASPLRSAVERGELTSKEGERRSEEKGQTIGDVGSVSVGGERVGEKLFPSSSSDSQLEWRD